MDQLHRGKETTSLFGVRVFFESLPHDFEATHHAVR